MSTLIAATRPTTLAGALANRRNLEPYLIATAVQQIFGSKDLRDAAAMLDPQGDWHQYKDVLEEAARRHGKPEAGQGSNIHTAVELMVSGRAAARIPADVLVDAEAAMGALRDLALIPVAAEERVVTEGLPELCAGTRDLLVKAADGTHHVADIKTTKALGSAKYRALEWAVQIAIYSRGNPWLGVGDFPRDKWQRPLIDSTLVGVEERKVDQSEGLVIEVERGTGRVECHLVDLDLGWKWAKLACDLRAAQKEADIETLKVAAMA